MSADFARDVIARWSDPDPKYVPLLRQGGVTAVVTEGAPDVFASACQQAGIKIVPAANVRTAGYAEWSDAPASGTLALKDGLWPGITQEPTVDGRGDETASASREPWIDANGFWTECLRAAHPSRPALLGYLPPESSDRMIPFDTLELALIEARVSGGNYLLALESRYRKALLAGDAKATAAWQQLGRTAKWLEAHSKLFGHPIIPAITQLVDEGEASAEIANLMYRRNASPQLVHCARPPAPDPENRRAVVAVELKAMEGPLKEKLLAHARAGSSVITGPEFPEASWKVERKEEDRNFYKMGRGWVVAYHEAVADPSEFSLDVIDVITHARRAVRLWNANTVIPIATRPPQGGALIHVINYGAPVDREFPARVAGNYKKATLLRPEQPPLELKPAKRGVTTEVVLPDVHRLGVVVLS